VHLKSQASQAHSESKYDGMSYSEAFDEESNVHSKVPRKQSLAKKDQGQVSDESDGDSSYSAAFDEESQVFTKSHVSFAPSQSQSSDYEGDGSYSAAPN